MDKLAIILFIGIILIVISFILEGFALLTHTIEHVYQDLTKDLIPHLFLLGILLIIYYFYRRLSAKNQN